MLSRFMMIGGMLWLTACQPVPDAKLTDLSTLDDEKQRDGLIHGNAAIERPTKEDDAKIVIHGDDITLAKAHVMSAKAERYQPTFRLEGAIIPHKQTTVTLPKDAKLDLMTVKTGSIVKAGDVVATFHQADITSPPSDTKSTAAQDDVPLATVQDPIPRAHENPSAKTTFEVLSPMSGKVAAIFTTDSHKVYPKTTPVLVVYDERFMKFISPLPAKFADYLAIGDGVNFDTEDGRVFGGQIEKILPNPKVADMMEIHVSITPEQAKKANLQLGERVGGYVNYGQIDVGVLVPSFAIFDENLAPLDLSELSTPPYKPATPKPAFLWTIGQDERLNLAPIVVIEYRPESDQYLIAGVRLEGLIVLTHLPSHAHGARVRLK